MLPLRPDHVILLAPSLERTVLAFRRAGFEVRSGGSFPPTIPFHNALVVFADEFYIELLGVRRRRDRLLAYAMDRLGIWRRRFAGRPYVEARIFGLMAEPAGFTDFCVRADRLDLEQLAECSGCAWQAISMQRTTASGEIAAWELAFPQDPRLPFVICDGTPRSVRIPPDIVHPNGVRSALSIHIGIAGDPRLLLTYERLLHDGASTAVQGPTVHVHVRSDGDRQVSGRPMEIEVKLSQPGTSAGALHDLIARVPGLQLSA